MVSSARHARIRVQMAILRDMSQCSIFSMLALLCSVTPLWVVNLPAQATESATCCSAHEHEQRIEQALTVELAAAAPVLPIGSEPSSRIWQAVQRPRCDARLRHLRTIILLI